MLAPHTSLRSLGLICAAALCALALTACKPSSTGASSDTQGKTTSSTRADNEAIVRSATGKACTIDTDCPLYLRCVASACAVPPAVDGSGDPASSPAVSIVSSEGEAQFLVELAIEPHERQRGLMHRPRMSDAWGMVFIYSRDQPQSFWMKNTLIPLDMVFINDARKVVGVVHNATPLTLDAREVEGNSRFILEVNAGLAKRFGIKAGDPVHFGRFPDGALD